MEVFMNTMIPDNNISSTPLTPVATLAFLDLETTGLPFEIGKKNVQITELSIIAVDRTDFENDSLLRVQNKLDLFVRPRSTISPGAMLVTNLDNAVLERQNPFDNNIPEVLGVFFKRLRSPICLVAHNGEKFDFPLLKAEIERLGQSLKADITCADTLQAFQNFGLVAPKNHENKEDDEIVCMKDLNVHKQDLHNFNLVFKDADPKNQSVILKDDFDRKIERMLEEGLEDFINLTEKPINQMLDQCLLPPSSNTITPPPSETKDPKCRPNYKLPKQSHASVKRQLFPNEKKIKPPKIKKPSLKLENIYSHYFGEPPSGAHQALSDCFTLCKVCQKVSDTFLPWLDEHQKPFSDIISMW